MTLSDFTEYVKQTWKNKPDTSTPLSAERLNHMEDGIQEISDAIKALAAAVCDEILNDPEKIASLAALYKVSQEVDKKMTSPDTAAVGQVLEVEAVDDNGKPTKYKAADSKAAPSDWNVHDENTAGYVKNRTHWKNVISEYELILDESTIEFTSTMASVSGIGSSNIKEGTTYAVYWNGTLYECTAYIKGSLMLGNAAIMSVGDDTGEPFCFEVFSDAGSLLMKSSSDAESVTIKVEVPENVEWKQLDPRFVPDMYYSEETEVEVLAETEVTYTDGVYKSNVGLSLTVGEQYTVIYNGTEYSCTAQEYAEDDASLGVSLGNVDFEYEGLSTGEPFVIVLFTNDEAISSFGGSLMIQNADFENPPTSATITITQNKEVVHCLDPKYIENMYYTEGGLVEVLPETTASPLSSYDPPAIEFTEPIGLVAGNTYIVNWNGVEYECVCADLSSIMGISTSGIGNFTTLGLSGNDEPFLLVELFDEAAIVQGGITAQLGVLDGSAEVTFSISTNNEIVHQIPKKFIPSAGDRAQNLIEITLSDDLKTGTTSTSFDTAYAMDVAELQSAIQIKTTGDNPYYFSVVAVQKELYMNTTPRILFTVHEHTDVDRQFFVRMFRWNSAGIDQNDDYSYLKYGYVPIDGENGKILQQSGNSWKAVFPTQIIMTASDDDSKKFRIQVDSTGAITATEVTS